MPDETNRSEVAQDGPGWRQILAALERIAASPAFAYPSIFLIQLKVLWGMWEWRDLPSGDTADYFTFSSAWAADFHLDPVWSPLYQVYFGTLQWLIPDTYEVTTVHRIVITVAVSLLVLAVFRRLLTPGIAWALAAWWALLPINYDTLYEVHLFSLIPALVAVLIAVSTTGVKRRAGVLAVLLVGGVFVRNELILAAVTWGLICIGYELWLRRRGQAKVSLKRMAVAFAWPSAIILALGAVVAFAIPYTPGDRTTGSEFDERNGLTVCQNYAFAYEQRTGDFGGTPLLRCEKLMQDEFGETRPSLTEAIRSNPGAMADHGLWNVRLLPSGLQLALFSEISASDRFNPDFIPVHTGSNRALLASFAVLAVVIVGLAVLWRERKWWWVMWLRERAWGWVALVSLVPTTAFAMMVTRPRPSYMFSLTVLVLVLFGTCVMVIAARWPALGRLRAALPLAAALLVAVPSHYGPTYSTPQNGRGQPVRQMVERFEDHADEIGGRTNVVLSARFGSEGCAYLGEPDVCSGINLQEQLDPRPLGTSLSEVLRDADVDVIYADETIGGNPGMRRFLRRLERKEGWTRVTSEEETGGDWVIIKRPSEPMAHGAS